MKKILVTGGLGYVGGRIVAHLLEQQAGEIYIDTRKTDIDVQQLFNSKNVFIASELSQIGLSNSFLHQYSDIIHLAAHNEIDCAKDPIAAAEFNVIHSLSLLQKAINNKVDQFVYFSTAHVYGAPLHGLVTEETITRPVHPYAITHKNFEDYVLAAKDKGEINGLVIRLSNSYGVPIWPNVNRWTLLVNDLCKQAATTGSLKLNSSGIQERDFVTLSDVARATHFLMQQAVEKTGNGIFNLGGSSQTVLSMANFIAERAEQLLGKKIEVIVPINSAESAKQAPLVFSSKRLQSSGFVYKGNQMHEIDELLTFCIKHF